MSITTSVRMNYLRSSTLSRRFKSLRTRAKHVCFTKGLKVFSQACNFLMPVAVHLTHNRDASNRGIAYDGISIFAQVSIRVCAMTLIGIIRGGKPESRKSCHGLVIYAIQITTLSIC